MMMSKMYLQCIILSVLCICSQLVVSSCPNPSNPGVVAGITQEGLNDGKGICIIIYECIFIVDSESEPYACRFILKFTASEVQLTL